MAPSGVLMRINQVGAALTAAEARVADYLTTHADDVRDMSIAVLAQRCAVSEASVVRLCKKLHLTGYRELRLALAQDAGDSRAHTLHEDVEPADSPAAVVSKVFASVSRALADTLTIVDDREVERCISVLARASTINFFGIGASGVVAQDAYFRFMKAGIKSYALTDSSSQLTRVASLGSDDVVVAISHSGRSRDLVYALTEARRRGAFVIGITQFGRQPMVHACDATLFTSSRETAFRSEAMASRILQHTLLDALFIGVALTDLASTTDHLDTARALTAHMREAGT